MFSDKISLDRSLPDVRISECKAVKYDLKSLPKASVVIIFTVGIFFGSRLAKKLLRMRRGHR